MIINCKYCSNGFECKRITRKWCSDKCRNDAVILRRDKRCVDCNKLIKNFTAIRCGMCAYKLVNHNWGIKIRDAKLGKPNSSKTKFKNGSLHPNYTNGQSYKSERLQLVGLQEYKNWRTSVFKRDNYVCIGCKRIGGKLQAHHIKEWCNYPELRYKIGNGVTLCVECHRKTDNYGLHKKIHNNTIVGKQRIINN